MARMVFRAPPVTPVPGVRRRLAESRRRSPPAPTPFTESAWQLRDGLDMRERFEDEPPTEPGELPDPPKGTR